MWHISMMYRFSVCTVAGCTIELPRWISYYRELWQESTLEKKNWHFSVIAGFAWIAGNALFHTVHLGKVLNGLFFNER